MYKRYLKRPLDIVFSLLAAVILSPAILIIAVLVRIRLGRPVLFRQQRPGKDERIFTLYKFRTMTDKRDEHGELLPDAERLIKFGCLLRSTSLDELPELLNILRGDMSFVGPRPLLAEYLPFYTEQERLRHTVRPGLTGLAQINGRNYIPWDQRLAKDIEYIQHITIRKDIAIIAITLFQVIKKSNISIDADTAETDLAKERMQKAKQSIRAVN